MSQINFSMQAMFDPRLAIYAVGGAPAWVWSADGARILWANAAGKAFFRGAGRRGAGQRRHRPGRSASPPSDVSGLPLTGFRRAAAGAPAWIWRTAWHSHDLRLFAPDTDRWLGRRPHRRLTTGRTDMAAQRTPDAVHHDARWCGRRVRRRWIIYRRQRRGGGPAEFVHDCTHRFGANAARQSCGAGK